MIKKLGDLLTDQYGYELRGFVSHPLKDKYDVMFGSGPVTVLLTDDINAEVVTLSIVENEISTSTPIHYGCEDYADVVLNALATFALRRMEPR